MAPNNPSRTDLNLLFGILALQMDFIDREQLVRAMQTWLCDKGKTLGTILVEQNVLTTPRLILLQALVEEHLKQHENDPQKSLAAIAPEGSLGKELLQIADSDMQATLLTIGNGRSDPVDANARTVVGSSTSAGLRFRILRPHARGGLGTVYVAHDEELHREVALKEIQDLHAQNKDSRARFLLEAEITGRLEHPGIVPVYGLGQYADGRPFYAMRFIKGDSLQDAIEAYHKPRPDESVNLAEQGLALRGLLGRFIDVCDAIQYAHDRGVLHRDLKPGNIMLGKYGETLVVDWGLAKSIGVKEPLSEESSLKPSSISDTAETLQGSAIGTPSFMSPEQAAGRLDQMGPASDVYSLGATLYCLLTGRAPIEASSAMQDGKVDLGTILKMVQRGEFPKPRHHRPDVDRALEAVCLKAMALKPADRYRSPRALASDLEHWLADRPVGAWREPWSVRTRRWVGRHRTIVTSVAAALLVGVVSLMVLNVVQKAHNDSLALSNKKEKEAKDKETRAREEERLAKLAAVADKKLADDERKKAVHAGEETAGALARATTMLAQSRFAEGLVELANDSLDDVAPQFRSIGWRFLKRKFEGSYCTLYGHLSPVNAVAFSPDGEHLASGSIDRTVRVWNGRTGNFLWSGKGHTSGITGLAFSPDGSLLATCSWDGTVKVWDVQARKELVTFKKHARDVAGVAFSPDGARIASASDDATIKIWDPRTGTEFLTLTGHKGPVRGVAFSPDGKRLASASDDLTVKIWDVVDNQGPVIPSPLLTLTGHSERIWGVAFSPDGKRLASASDDDTVKIWDGKTDKETFTLRGHGNDVRCVSFSPDGQYLATGSYDSTVRLWDAASGKESRTFRGHSSAVAGISFSPDGQRLASASADKTVKLWEVGQEFLTVRGHQGPIKCAVLNHDGSRLATAGEDHVVKLWDVRTGQVVQDLAGHAQKVRSLAFNVDGRRLASCGDDETIRIWDAESGTELRKLTGHKGNVRSVAFAPDGKRLASAGDDMAIKIWDVAAGQEIETLKGHTGSVSCVAFSPQGHRLASASFDSTIKIWNLATFHEFLSMKGHNDVVESLSFSPDGDKLASGSFDRMVKIWDVGKGQEILSIDAHAKAVTGVAFHPDGQRLASAGKDGLVKIWDAVTGLELQTIPGHTRGVDAVSFSDDGQFLVSAGVSAGDDQTVRLWDVSMGKEGQVFKEITSRVRTAAISPDGDRFVWASWQGVVQMWDAQAGKELATLSGHTGKVAHVVFSHDGATLATAGEDQTVILWDGHDGKKLRTLKGHSGAVLHLAFTLDGNKLASASADHTIKIWDVHTGADLKTLTGHSHEVRGVAFRFDGKRLASASYDKMVKVWDLDTGRDLLTLDGHKKWVTSVSYRFDGTRIISRDAAEMLMVWDPETGKVLTQRTKDPDPSPFPAAIDRDGNKLILTSSKRIQIIDLTPPDGKELAYRQAMSRPRPWWHEEQAGRSPTPPFAAAFHWSWIVQAEPMSMDKWRQLDDCCQQLGNWQHAQAACIRLLKEEPKLDLTFPVQAPFLNLALARAYHRLGDKARARESFDRAQMANNLSAEQRIVFDNVSGEAAQELGLKKKQP